MNRPNVILLVTDDHAAWAMGHAGAIGLPTPNLDRLANQGLRFTQALTPSPVCSPARACLMTGLTPSKVGIHDWLQEYDAEVAARDWLSGIDTLPEMFQRAGYNTYLSGKWHLGATPSIPRGFDHAFGMGRKVASHNGLDTYTIDGEPVELKGNRSRLIGDYACRYLESASPDEPFFLNVGFFATHSPYREDAHDPQLIEAIQDNDFPDLPRSAHHTWLQAENGPNPREDLESECRKRWRGYYAGVMEIDRELGRILNTLEATGRDRDTLIIYTSDHGCCLGHHGVWGKGNGTRPVNFYDTSLKVPLLIKGPGIPTNQKISTPVSHYDTFATIQSMCGLEPNDGNSRSGQQLTHIDKDTQLDIPRATYHEYGDARAIRTATWKIIRRNGHHPNQAFHLESDPNEEHPQPIHAAPERLADQLNRYDRQMSCQPCDGLLVNKLPRHNDHEPWRDGRREQNLAQSEHLPQVEHLAHFS